MPVKSAALPQRLYHYTSINALALILSTRSIRFTRLDRVNDPEDGGFTTAGPFGFSTMRPSLKDPRRSVFVSCWTDQDKESIPLWNLYTPQMTGCRIRMCPEAFGPLVQCSRGGYCIFLADAPTVGQIKGDGSVRIETVFGPFPVIYTDDHKILKPSLLAETLNDEVDEPFEWRYDYWPIGLSKLQHWSFEKEWRYRCFAATGHTEKDGSEGEFDLEEFEEEDVDWDEKLRVRHVDIEIVSSAMDDIEIVLGPKASSADLVLVDALKSKYAPAAIVRESSIKVR